MIKKIIITLLLLLYLGGNAFAENKPELSCKSAVLIDMESGRVLYDYNKDIELPQASITKLMTYLVFKDYLRYSQIGESYETNMGDIKKWNLPSDGSVSGIKSGEIVTISQLFDALLIASGNDSAMMLQDVYNTSGRDMIADMNSKAKELGLTKSKYVNVSGLTMESESGRIYNVTTAYETAVLGKKVIETYPEILKITSNKYFQYNNIKKNSTDDLLLDKELNVDGLKTGHTGEAGYCVISTAEISKNPEEKPFRLISVVLGSPTKNSRFDDSKRLLEYGRDNYSYVRLLKEINPENAQFKLKTEYYKGGEISGSIPDDAYILKGKEETIQYEVVFDRELPSKINKGDKIGKIIITGSDDRNVEFNLLASEEFKSVSFFKKFVIYFKHLLKF